VDAALSILETLGSVHDMGLTELARKLGLGKSSVHRLLASLVTRGYVEKNPESDRYRLTYRLFGVGSRAASRLGLRDTAHPVMERLAAQTGETVNLGVLDGTRVLSVHRVESQHLLRMHLEIGGGIPAHATALGKVLLAGLAPNELTRRLRGQRLERLTPNTLADRSALRRALGRVREAGFATDDEECSLGLRCVAAPILDHRGLAAAAVSVSGPSLRLPLPTLTDMAAPVREAAREISHLLGHLAVSPVGRAYP
jgi:IclR family acetate operon transcriptional repressor